MIRHAMNGEHFSFSVLHKPCDVFMQFLFMLSRDQALPSFDGKSKLQIDLGKRVRHKGWFNARSLRKSHYLNLQYSTNKLPLRGLYFDGYNLGFLSHKSYLLARAIRLIDIVARSQCFRIMIQE